MVAWSKINLATNCRCQRITIILNKSLCCQTKKYCEIDSEESFDRLSFITTHFERLHLPMTVLFSFSFFSFFKNLHIVNLKLMIDTEMQINFEWLFCYTETKLKKVDVLYLFLFYENERISKYSNGLRTTVIDVCGQFALEFESNNS